MPLAGAGDYQETFMTQPTFMPEQGARRKGGSSRLVLAQPGHLALAAGDLRRHSVRVLASTRSSSLSDAGRVFWPFVSPQMLMLQASGETWPAHRIESLVDWWTGLDYVRMTIGGAGWLCALRALSLSTLPPPRAG